MSRSGAYRRYFRDEPPIDNLGKLGSFVPGRKTLHPSFQDEFGQSNEDGTRYDLAHPNYVPESYGSGIAIEGSEKLILTNYHVVREATKIYVRVAGGKGSYADIYAADPRSALAVLRLLD